MDQPPGVDERESVPVEAPDGPSPHVSNTLPAVVIVMVAHDPGTWFDETLQSLEDQTYPDLALMVVDTASDEDVTERVRAVVPTAHVRRLDHDPGYGAAVNSATELVDGASYFLLCHDDVRLEPDAVRAMVEEALRSNAGIVGPKLVDWHDPRRILQVGLGVDKTGVLAPIAEVGELDQEQHDAVRDVFVVPGGCTLVRSDLFDALGGFDPAIVGLGDDLDLCWRAHTLGARVLIAPAARVAHLEAMGERSGVDDRRRLAARHRLRTTLVAYGWFHRLRVIPQAFLFGFIEAFYATIAGRPDQARDVLTAWSWNIRRWRSTRRRHRELQAMRRVGDNEIRAMQVRGSARLNAFIRGQFRDRDDRVSSLNRSSRDIAGAVRDSSRQLTGTFALVLALILAISSRELLMGRIPAIGEFAVFPDGVRDFFDAWWSGWHRDGLGGAGFQPTGFGLLGLASMLFGGATSLLRTVLVVAPIPLGALGAWRLARPVGSARASVAAFAVYLAIPLPYNALARGSWSGLLMYGLSPWMLLLLGRASGIAPFGPGQAEPDERAATLPARRIVGLILGLGLLLGLVAAFVPFVIVIALGVLAALTLGSLLCFRVAGVARMLLVGLGATALAVALNLPWSYDLLRSDSTWSASIGLGSSVTDLDVGHLVRFETGPWGAPPLGFAFLLAGALPVVIGRSWRLEWAVRSWFVVLAGWGTMWAAGEGHITTVLPAPEVALAPVAAALAFSAALGLTAFETDLRAYRFGWRQLLSVAAAFAVVLGALPLGSGLLDGRWEMPTRDFNTSLRTLLEDNADAPSRVLWVGTPEMLPAAGWRYDDQLAYTATDRGVPTILDRFPSEPPGSSHLLADVLRIAEEHRTNRAGHLLAPMGVRYIVIPERLAPPPETEADGDPTPGLPTSGLAEALTQQLDLRVVPLRDGVTVLENTAWVSVRAILPSVGGERDDYTQAITDDLSDARPVLEEERGAVDAAGTVSAEGRLHVASSADPGWELRIGGVPMQRELSYGWANSFSVTRTGEAELTFENSLPRRLAAGGQAVLWVLVAVAWRRTRNRERIALDRARRTGQPPTQLETS